MKGKVSVYFNLPNLGRLNSRVKNRPEGLSQDLRNDVVEAVVKTLNSNQLQLKAELINAVSKKKLEYNNAAHEASVNNVLGDIFTSLFATTREGIEPAQGVAPKSKAEKTQDSLKNGAKAAASKVTKTAKAPAANDDFEV